MGIFRLVAFTQIHPFIKPTFVSSSSTMVMRPAASFTLRLLDSDGTSIPRIGWGNGTGQALKSAVECSRLALENGIRHIDTAQIYYNEEKPSKVSWYL